MPAQPATRRPVLYYAIGGGLGHLTRARAVLHTLGVDGPITLISASHFAHDARVHGTCDVIAPDPTLAHNLPCYRTWLRYQLDRLRPCALYLDAFPAGILGEFCGFPLPDMPIYYLARRLRWPVYQRQFTTSPPKLKTTFVFEPLDPAHARFVKTQSSQVQPLELRDPPTPVPESVMQRLHHLKQEERPLWLIVHAGNDDEISELLSYAVEVSHREEQQPCFVLIAPRCPPHLPPGVLHLDVYPAQPLFPLADRLITAGGFNAMRHAAPFADRHLAYPFPRRFDDQFARVALHQRHSTAGACALGKLFSRFFL